MISIRTHKLLTMMLFVGNCLSLPPVEFIAQFASKHGRTSVAFYLPSMPHSTSIVKYWSLMMQSSFPIACVFQSIDKPLESLQFGDTDLHLFIPYLIDLKQSPMLFSSQLKNPQYILVFSSIYCIWKHSSKDTYNS